MDVCVINPRPAQKIPAETAISVLRSSSIDSLSGHIIDLDVQRMDQVQMRSGLFQKRDVLLATVGADMMKSTLITELPTEMGIANNFLVLRAGPQLLPEYLLHFVRQPWVKKAARAANRGTVRQLAIPTDFFRDLQLPLPPVPEQEFLVRLFDKASLQPYQIALERSVNVSAALSQRLILSGLLAKQWPTLPLSELCELQRATSLTARRLRHSRFLLYSPHGIAPLTQAIMPSIISADDLPKTVSEVSTGDVLFSPARTERLSAKVSVIPDYDDVEPRLASNHFQVLRPGNKLLPEYLAALLSLPWLNRQLVQIGQIHGRLSRQFMERLDIPVPSIERQREILNALDAVPTLRLKAALEAAERLARALYNEGFSGRLTQHWRESYGDPNEVSRPVSSLSSVDGRPPERYTPSQRTARNTLIGQLSTIQTHVWSALCQRRAPLLIDDTDAIATFCSTLQPQATISPATLKSTLRQLAALGLVRQMSIPGPQNTFIGAFRRFRITESGRAQEDSALRDAQLLRDNIADPDWGQ